MRSINHRFIWPIMASLAIAGGSYFAGLSGAQLSHTAVAADPQANTARPTQQPQSSTVAPATDLARAFRAVHESLKDAVVNINVTKSATSNANVQMDIPEQFRGMLPPDFQDQLRNQMQNQRVEGTGSGVIVNADGYILTNNHVVSNADEIKVTLNDGRELKGEVVGTDPKTDLAVIRVKADHLTFAKFGDSEALQVGDWVLAFGSPFGISQTMTQGIISAKGRTHMNIIASHDPSLRQLTYENYLQTDAAINPGNSGGPLVNLQGEVVGINSAIASSTGAYNGIGFSIPSNDAQYIMKSLIENGKVVRGYLGIGIEDINNPAPEHKGLVDALKKNGFGGNKGVLVGSVLPEGPAGKAGVQDGDVITAINCKAVTTVEDLRNEIARTKPDSKLNLSVYRDGKDMQVASTVGVQPETMQQAAQLATGRGNARNRDTVEQQGELGIRVQDVDAATAKRENLSDRNGAMVTAVNPNSVAAVAGLEPGDVIRKVDKTEVTTAKQFADAIKNAKLSDGVKLTVRGDDGMDKLVYVEKK
ncbi:MAG TPA: trypsin-like peptidase domain-containing protein [Phycisphaerae bacterium]|nr:trypsin-like peptidase domain-containing protein [Phycisphaerae bacterium]